MRNVLFPSLNQGISSSCPQVIFYAVEVESFLVPAYGGAGRGMVKPCWRISSLNVGFSHQFQQHLSCVGYTITWTTDHLMMLQQEWRSSFLFLFCFVYFNTKNTVDIPLFRSTRNRVWNVVFLKNDSWIVGYVYVKKNFFYIVPWNLRCLSYN